MVRNYLEIGSNKALSDILAGSAVEELAVIEKLSIRKLASSENSKIENYRVSGQVLLANCESAEEGVKVEMKKKIDGNKLTRFAIRTVPADSASRICAHESKPMKSSLSLRVSIDRSKIKKAVVQDAEFMGIEIVIK